MFARMRRAIAFGSPRPSLAPWWSCALPVAAFVAASQEANAEARLALLDEA